MACRPGERNAVLRRERDLRHGHAEGDGQALEHFAEDDAERKEARAAARHRDELAGPVACPPAAGTSPRATGSKSHSLMESSMALRSVHAEPRPVEIDRPLYGEFAVWIHFAATDPCGRVHHRLAPCSILETCVEKHAAAPSRRAGPSSLRQGRAPAKLVKIKRDSRLRG